MYARTHMKHSYIAQWTCILLLLCIVYGLHLTSSEFNSLYKLPGILLDQLLMSECNNVCDLNNYSDLLKLFKQILSTFPINRTRLLNIVEFDLMFSCTVNILLQGMTLCVYSYESNYVTFLACMKHCCKRSGYFCVIYMHIKLFSDAF